MGQANSYGILQGLQLDRSIGKKFIIPPAWMGLVPMIFLIKIIVALTKGNGGPHWLGGNDLNKNRLEHYYHTIAALGVLNLLYFVFFARRFLSNEVLQRQSQSEARDLENANHQ